MFNGVGGKTSVGYGFFDNIEIIKSKQKYEVITRELLLALKKKFSKK